MDYISMGDIRKLNASLHWLVNWAKQKWESKNNYFGLGKNNFVCYQVSEFSDCPSFNLGFYSLVALRKDIARKTNDGNIEICIGRLAELKL